MVSRTYADDQSVYERAMYITDIVPCTQLLRLKVSIHRCRTDRGWATIACGGRRAGGDAMAKHASKFGMVDDLMKCKSEDFKRHGLAVKEVHPGATL